VTTVCLAPVDTLRYLHGGGGHFWVYLNWALGLRAQGCRVLWLEWLDTVEAGRPLPAMVAELERRLAPHGIALALDTLTGAPRPGALDDRYPDLAAAAEADVLLDFRYALPAPIVRRFRRSVLVDIDPGLLQIWMSEGQMPVAPHDVAFTIGETVGRPGSRCPDAGLAWHYTPPPVCLAAWGGAPAPAGAPYTTVSSWRGNEWLAWGGEVLANDKRASFLDYLDLPRRGPVTLELALCLGDGDEDDRRLLERRGWRVRRAWDVCATGDDYRRYVQGSRAEFGCAKPSCMRLQNAWISDRTLCYLASGRPAVVQHTGPSRFLPDASGLLRVRDLDEAVRRLEAVEADYDHHCREARGLAEAHFDAIPVTRRVLEVALA
jgi:hypothetical protein